MATGQAGEVLSSLNANAAIKTADPVNVAMVCGRCPADNGCPHEAVHEQQHPSGHESAPASRRMLARHLPRRLSGAARALLRPPTTVTGGFTKNTNRQPGPCVSTPPRKTPAAAAIPLMAPQAPRAVLRSLPSRKLVVECRKRSRCHERGARTLHEARGDQESRVVSQTRGSQRSPMYGEYGCSPGGRRPSASPPTRRGRSRSATSSDST